jgi:hypothetical protein
VRRPRPSHQTHFPRSMCRSSLQFFISGAQSSVVLLILVWLRLRSLLGLLSLASVLTSSFGLRFPALLVLDPRVWSLVCDSAAHLREQLCSDLVFEPSDQRLKFLEFS